MSRELSRAPLPLPHPEPLETPSDFGERLTEIGVTLEPEMIARIGDYLARLLAMNELVNLTSITEPSEVWSRHALDALSLVPELADLKPGSRLVDIGSGGGVPGIILAIARPDLTVVLVEATEKKAVFLKAVSHALGLENVSVVSKRAEQVLASDLPGTYDAVTARAVAKLETLLPWTAPFAKRGGRLLLIKGERAAEELEGAKRALGRYRCKHERTVKTATGRVVVLSVS